MSNEQPINKDIDNFRQASRELFNQYFRVEDPRADECWLFHAFNDVQALLFEKMVLDLNKIKGTGYGEFNPHIRVVLQSDFAPIMVNRQKNSGYWDFPLKEVTKDVHMSFIKFFDWDESGCRDNQYVLVTIDEWLSHPDATGKQALILAQYVSYVHMP